MTKREPWCFSSFESDNLLSFELQAPTVPVLQYQSLKMPLVRPLESDNLFFVLALASGCGTR